MSKLKYEIESLKERILKLENPPKFEYGDIVCIFGIEYCGYDEVQADKKNILHNEAKVLYSHWNNYRWIYTLDSKDGMIYSIKEVQLELKP